MSVRLGGSVAPVGIGKATEVGMQTFVVFLRLEKASSSVPRGSERKTQGELGSGSESGDGGSQLEVTQEEHQAKLVEKFESKSQTTECFIRAVPQQQKRGCTNL